LGVLGNALVLYGRDHPYLRPRMSAVTWAGGKRLCRMGSLFLALQLAAALGFSSDNLVAAQVVGGHAVPSYAIPYRLFALSLTVVQLLAGPLWPAYTEAITRGDRAWVRRTLVRSLTLSVSISLASSVLLLVFGNAILAVWVGPHIRASYWLLLGLAIWNVFSGAGVSMAMLFNGAHVVGFQVASALSMAVLNICLSIALARQVGLPGIIWGTVISYGLCAVIPWIFFVPRLLRLQGGAVDEPPSGAVAAAPPLAS
jgi:O-antigen/teichoic acid export membrane protein